MKHRPWSALTASGLVATIVIAFAVASRAAEGDKEPPVKQKDHEIVIALKKPPKDADLKTRIRVIVVNKSGHVVEPNGTVVLRHEATGEVVMLQFPGLVKNKTLINEVHMANAPDLCVSSFEADSRDIWFRAYAPGKQFHAVTIQLAD